MNCLLRSCGAHRWTLAFLTCLAPALSPACVVYDDKLVNGDGGEGGNVIVSGGQDNGGGSNEGGSGSGSSIPDPVGSQSGNTSSPTGNQAGMSPTGTSGTGAGATGTMETGGSEATGTGMGGTTGVTTGTAGGQTTQGGTTQVQNGGGGSTGGTDAAGAENTGGEGGAPVVVPVDDPVIDTMQDSNNRINVAEGRNGYWFTFNDMSAGGTQVPAAGATFTMATVCDPARETSTRCARSLVTGDFEVYGSGMGFDFHSNKTAYDVSKYSGIKFWAKNDDETTGDVTLAVATVSTEAATDTPAFEYLLPLDTVWTEYTVSFDQLVLSDWYSGDPIAWAATEVLKVQFKTPLSVTHDIYVDDIVFVE